MAFLTSAYEGEITLQLNLLPPNISEWTDWELERVDFENWIAFSFSLKTKQEEQIYPASFGATFCLSELKNFLLSLDCLIKDKKQLASTINECKFYTLERYFDLEIYDVLEDDVLRLEIWIIQGAITDGLISDFDKGFRFCITLNALEKFKEELSTELNEIKKFII